MHKLRYVTGKNEALVKAAFEKISSAARPGLITQLAPVLGLAAAVSGVAGLAGYFGAKRRQEAYGEALDTSLRNLATYHPDYSGNPSLTAQRFNELSIISPTLASNASLAHKVIHPRLKSGFSLEDIERLATIENKTSTAPAPTTKYETPASIGTAAALGKLEQQFRLFGPAIVDVTREHFIGGPLREKDTKIQEQAKTINALKSEVPGKVEAAKSKKEMETIRDATAAMTMAMQDAGVHPEKFPRVMESFGKHLTKKGSDSMYDVFDEQVVSDECLGRMLATRHLMFKEAGLLKEAGMLAPIKEFFAGGAQMPKSTGSLGATFNYFKAMSVPLALTLGFGAVNKILQMRENRQMAQQADVVFGQLKRTSDVVKQNPEVAEQAFDSLRSFAPVLATKPMIAKTFVEDIVNKGGLLPPQTADMLAGAQRKIMDVAETAPAPASEFITGLKEPMGLFGFTPPGGKAALKGDSGGRAKTVVKYQRSPIPKKLMSFMTSAQKVMDRDLKKKDKGSR